MNNKLLTEHHLAFLSLKWGCTVSSEFTLVKMPHCWKSHVVAQISSRCLFGRTSVISIIPSPVLPCCYFSVRDVNITHLNS